MNRFLRHIVYFAMLAAGCTVDMDAPDNRHAGYPPETRRVAERPDERRVTDLEKDYSIAVPRSWQQTDQHDDVTRFVWLTGGRSSPDAQPPVFIVVVVGPDAADPSLRDVATFAAGMKDQLGRHSRDIRFERDVQTTLDGERAIRFSYTKNTRVGPAKFRDLVAIHNGRGYSISFACDPRTFDDEVHSTRPAFESFRWTN